LLLLNLTLPRINPEMSAATIDRILIPLGAAVPIGGRLLDLTVDLSAAATHDCPPISHYRLVSRDRVWLRRLDVSAGAEPEVGACLGLFSTEPDEPLTGPPARLLRYVVAGIIPQSSWDEALS
jgi:hypothetical protein